MLKIKLFSLLLLGAFALLVCFHCSGCSGTPEAESMTPGEDYQPVDVSIPDCDGNCHYVRSDAGGLNDGSDWDNAYTVLPDQLERNAIYFVAKGDYPVHVFNDAQNGEQYIYIIKAAQNFHGTDTGWKTEYGGNSAKFGKLQFNKSFYIMDGLPGRGFEITGGYKGAIVQITADYVTIRNCYLNGNFTTNSSNYHVNGACTGLSIYGNDITIKNCDIYSIADDGLEMHGGNHLAFINNKIYNLQSCGTDTGTGPCNNGHSDSIEVYNVKNSEFSGNFIYDNNANAALFFGNWAASSTEYCENIKLSNNIFYIPNAGFVVYFIDVAGLKVYNNVFWGTTKGAFGGLSMGNNVTNLDMYNNIILSINYTYSGAAYDPANHRGDYNLIGVSFVGLLPEYYHEQSHDIVYKDPGFLNIPAANGSAVISPSAVDFQIKITSPCIDKGFAGNSNTNIPANDYFGNTRPNGSSFDIGGHEYQH